MNEPENFNLSVDGELFEATPFNTTLQEYAGSLCVYNNILLEHLNDEGETESAHIIFSEADVYQHLRKIIEEHHFPMYLNIPKVGEGVMSAYINWQMTDLDETPDWLDGNA